VLLLAQRGLDTKGIDIPPTGVETARKSVDTPSLTKNMR